MMSKEPLSSAGNNAALKYTACRMDLLPCTCLAIGRHTPCRTMPSFSRTLSPSQNLIPKTWTSCPLAASRRQIS